MSRELMQQALEALEKVTKHFTRTPSTLMDSEARVEAHKAITALRQALEEEREPLYWSVSTGWVYANDTSQERVDEAAEQEREPVAWADKVGAVIPHSHKLFQPDLFKDYTRPLYTAPQKKEWVGLTDEEISYCRYAATFCDELDTAYMAELIEKDLKEKNT